MNFVFISPNFPENYWMFCRGLKKHGATVLAIVDCPYDSLSKQLKEHIDECYVVPSLEDYDDPEVIPAISVLTDGIGEQSTMKKEEQYAGGPSYHHHIISHLITIKPIQG